MSVKTATVLHTLGVALVAAGVAHKWTVEGMIFAVFGGALCAISLEQIVKPKRKKEKK